MAEATKIDLTAGHYDVLGVAESATEQEIGEAEKAVRKAHDHRAHLGDAAATAVLSHLNEARAVLLDPARRAAYAQSPQALWESFADPAHALPVTRGERLSQIRAWLSGEHDPVRAATLLDVPAPDRLLRRQALLGDEPTGPQPGNGRGGAGT